MLTYFNIDPVAFHIGSWPVYWYGLMYLVGFAGGWFILSMRLKMTAQPLFTQEQLGDIIFYTALGAIVGGRVGYVLFYDTAALFTQPLIILQPWKGGMSFHGGLLGVLVALLIYAKRLQKPFLDLTDFIAPAVPLGLFAGRIGNFINGELWGRVTAMPWGMVFPNKDTLLRHPSQLYEAFFEGIVLFIILWCYTSKPRSRGAVSGLFALCYGLFRILVECFREPDPQIGYLGGWFTEGQLLSLPLVIIGLILIYIPSCKQKEVSP